MPDNIYNHLEIVRYQSSINIHLCTQFFFHVLYCINLNKKNFILLPTIALQFFSLFRTKRFMLDEMTE